MTVVDQHEKKRVESKTPYLVISSDSHAGPSLERSLRPYCPPEYLEPFDAFVGDLRSGAIARGERDDQITLGDQIINKMKGAMPTGGVLAEALEQVSSCLGHDDPHARLRDMDADGIAAEVIFAGGQNEEVLPFVGFGADSGPKGVSSALRLVGEQIWNRWLADFVSVAPERLLGVAQVPVWDVDAAVREVGVVPCRRPDCYQLSCTPNRSRRIQQSVLRTVLVGVRIARNAIGHPYRRR